MNSGLMNSEEILESLFNEHENEVFNTILNSLTTGICLVSPAYTLLFFNECFRSEFEILYGINPVAGLSLMKDKRLVGLRKGWIQVFKVCMETRKETAFHPWKIEQRNQLSIDHRIFPLQKDDRNLGFVIVSKSTKHQKKFRRKKGNTNRV